jgi:hypothetical protein
LDNNSNVLCLTDFYWYISFSCILRMKKTVKTEFRVAFKVTDRRCVLNPKSTPSKTTDILNIILNRLGT